MNLLFVDTEFKFTDDTELVVHAPDFLKKMAEKVAVTSPRVLANYLVWRITESRIIYLNQELQDIRNKFWRVSPIFAENIIQSCWYDGLNKYI